MSATIRLARGSDAAGILAIYAPVVRETPISFEAVPPDVSEMRQRIENTLVRFPWLVCADHEQILGYAYASQHRTRAAYQWSVDVSVYVHPTARRSGVGKSMYTALLKLLHLQGFFNAYAGINLPNPASVGLHESVGFRLVGIFRTVGYKLGAWHDVGWWHLALRPHTAPAGPPVDLGQMRGSPETDAALAAGMTLIKI